MDYYLGSNKSVDYIILKEKLLVIIFFDIQIIAYILNSKL